MGLPIPDETLLTLTGYLIFKGDLHLVPTFFSALLGTMSGISLSYIIGRYGGVRFLRRFGPRLHITREQLERVHRWFTRHGRWSLLLGYFVPGVRHVVAIVAGGSGLETRYFALFAYSGACLWAAVFIGAGFYLGEGWDKFPGVMRTVAIGLFAVLVLGSGMYLYIRTYAKKHRR